MEKIDIYYTTKLVTESISGREHLTGKKDISIYKIEKNKLVLLGEVSCKIIDYSRNIVVVWLFQNHINFNEITKLN
jgi:hypothetical protein